METERPRRKTKKRDQEERPRERPRRETKKRDQERDQEERPRRETKRDQGETKKRDQERPRRDQERPREAKKRTQEERPRRKAKGGHGKEKKSVKKKATLVSACVVSLHVHVPVETASRREEIPPQLKEVPSKAAIRCGLRRWSSSTPDYLKKGCLLAALARKTSDRCSAHGHRRLANQSPLCRELHTLPPVHSFLPLRLLLSSPSSPSSSWSLVLVLVFVFVFVVVAVLLLSLISCLSSR